jgi:hypothetical protein
MFTRDGVRALHGWTHASLDLVVEHAGSLPAGLLVREVPGFSLPSLRHQFLHILSWEATWVCNLRGVPAGVLAPDDHHDLTALIEAKRRVKGETTAYLDGTRSQHGALEPAPRVGGTAAEPGLHSPARGHPCLPSQGPDGFHLPAARPPCA